MKVILPLNCNNYVFNLSSYNYSVKVFQWIFYKLYHFTLVSIFPGQDNFTINAKPSSVLQIKGSSVYIDCITTGTKKPIAITWFFKGSPVQNDFDVQVYKNNTLYIKSLSRTYKGTYTCQARFDALTTKSVMVLVDFAGIHMNS